MVAPATVDSIARQIGYRRKHNDIAIEVREDGSAQYTFTATYQSLISELRQVHMRFVSESQERKQVGLVVLKKQCQDIRVNPDPDHAGFVYIHFEPFLALDQEAEFRVTINAPAGTYYWNAAALTAHRQGGSSVRIARTGLLANREFFDHTVVIPTESLRMSLTLVAPGGVVAQPEVSVWMDEEGGVHRAATARLNASLQRPAPGRATLNEAPPLFGAHYIWSWQLPPSA